MFPACAGRGEERFLVECSPSSDEVRYEVCAVFRPAQLLARLGYPGARAAQWRFGWQSGRTIRHGF